MRLLTFSLPLRQCLFILVERIHTLLSCTLRLRMVLLPPFPIHRPRVPVSRFNQFFSHHTQPNSVFSRQLYTVPIDTARPLNLLDHKVQCFRTEPGTFRFLFSPLKKQKEFHRPNESDFTIKLILKRLYCRLKHSLPVRIFFTSPFFTRKPSPNRFKPLRIFNVSSDTRKVFIQHCCNFRIIYRKHRWVHKMQQLGKSDNRAAQQIFKSLKISLLRIRSFLTPRRLFQIIFHLLPNIFCISFL